MIRIQQQANVLLASLAAVVATTGRVEAQTPPPNLHRPFYLGGTPHANDGHNVGCSEFSHYFNIYQAGVAQMLGLVTSAPVCAFHNFVPCDDYLCGGWQYGRPLPAEYFPIVDAWNVSPNSFADYLATPAASFTPLHDTGWCKYPLAARLYGLGVSASYRGRIAQLPSGATVLLFAPVPGVDCTQTQTITAGACPDAKVYDAVEAEVDEVFFFIQGYQGFNAHDVLKEPQWKIEPDDLYDESNRVNTFILEGTPEHDVMKKGHALAIFMPSIGFRPLVHTYAELVEATKWVDKALTRATPHDDYDEPRRFIMGVSYDGYVSRVAAMHMPWLFRGAIPEGSPPDMRQNGAFLLALQLWSSQLTGTYKEDQSLHTPIMRGLIKAEEKGYGGLDGSGNLVGVSGYSVDLADWSFIAEDLGLSTINADLDVPIILWRGDHDPVAAKFLDRNLPPGYLSLDEQSEYMVNRIMRDSSHGDPKVRAAWHEEQSLLGGGSLVDQLIALADDNDDDVGVPPPPGVGGFTWNVLSTPDDDSQSLEFAQGRQPDVSPAVPDVHLSFSVARVSDAMWDRREVLEGLASEDNLIVRTEDSQVVLYAPTARGDVAKLELIPDTANEAYLDYDIAWRKWTQAQGTKHFGTSELLLEGDSLYAVQHYGELVSFDLADADPDPVLEYSNDDPGPGDDRELGYWLSSLQSGGPNVFYAVNDEGELLKMDSGNVSKVYVEGGIAELVVDGDDAYYASPHGNIKRIDLSQANLFSKKSAHPTDLDDISDHMYSHPERLLDLPNGLLAAYLNAAPWDNYDDAGLCGGTCADERAGGLIILDKVSSNAKPMHALGHVKNMTGEGPLPPLLSSGTNVPIKAATVLHAGDRDGVQQHFFGLFKAKDPNTGCDTSAFATFTVEMDFAAPASPAPYPGKCLDGEWKGLCYLPGRATSVRRLPSDAPSLQGRDADGTAGLFPVGWVATTHAGQVVLIEDGVGSSLRYQILGEREERRGPFATFGITEAQGGRVLATAPQGRTFLFHPFNTNVLWFKDDTSNPSVYGNRTTGRPYQSAIIAKIGTTNADYRTFGFRNGADLHPQVGPDSKRYVVRPFEIHRGSPKLAWAGAQVIELNKEAAPLCKPDPEDQNPQNVDGPQKWSSENLQGPNDMGPAVGTTARWADLDGGGVLDVVVGTIGGRVVWYKGGGTTPYDLPSLATGELKYDHLQCDDVCTPPGPTDLAWNGDLGYRIFTIEVVDLDGDGKDELVIGTDWDTHPDYPEHFLKTGSVYVVELEASGNDLEIVAQYELDQHGAMGLRYIDIPEQGGSTTPGVVLGLARGKFRILEYDDSTSPQLLDRYESEFVAPMLGALDSILAFPHDGPGNDLRLVFGSSGGLFAFDLTAN